MTPHELWTEWCTRSHSAAYRRWDWLLGQLTEDQYPRRRLSDKEWLKQLKTQLTRLEEMGILGFRQAVRVRDISFEELARSDQDRVRRRLHDPRGLFALGLAQDPALRDQRPSQRSLRFEDGPRLHSGELSLQVFVNRQSQQAIGMNVQLHGLDPQRQRLTYLRYDLDMEQMGSGPVAHFCAHWHAGEDPGDPLAEELDPRLPALLLDPQDVLDVLVETFFPNGPKLNSE